MGTQGLHAAFVLVVPNPNGFVISTAHYESPTRMHQYPTHPVVMSHLKKQDRLITTCLTARDIKIRTCHILTAHQSHKADANADIPHLNGFISGSREKEGARLSTLLALDAGNI